MSVQFDPPAQTGGLLLGQGTYGCVFYPHLKCSHPKNLKKPNAVGKVFASSEEFKSEMDINKLIDKIDPKREFTLGSFGACITHPFQARPSDNIQKCDNIMRRRDRNAEVYQIFYEHGGVSLYTLATDKKKSVFLDSILQMFLPILNGVQKMHQYGLSHFDIKPDNIMYQPSGNRLLLVDFGLLSALRDIYTTNDLISASYMYYPPELRLFYAMQMQMPLLKRLDYLKESYKYTSVFRVLEALQYGTGRIETLISKAEEKGFSEFRRDCRTKFAQKVDVFSLGMAMIELFVLMQDRIKDPVFVHGFITSVVLPMVNFNPYERLTLPEAIKAYTNYMKKCNQTPLKSHAISVTPTTPIQSPTKAAPRAATKAPTKATKAHAKPPTKQLIKPATKAAVKPTKPANQ